MEMKVQAWWEKSIDIHVLHPESPRRSLLTRFSTLLRWKYTDLTQGTVLQFLIILPLEPPFPGWVATNVNGGTEHFDLTRGRNGNDKQKCSDAALDILFQEELSPPKIMLRRLQTEKFNVLISIPLSFPRETIHSLCYI